MPSEAQIAANRRNAKLSTGPRTPAGRARSAMNATKSGIYAKSQIIPGEDPAVLEDLKSRIFDSLQPAAEEVPLVDQLIDSDWQLRRLRRAEAELWSMSIAGDREKNRKNGLPEDHEVHFRAIEDNKDTFERIYRLQASTARILNRSLETLIRLRKAGPLLSPANPEHPKAVGQAFSPANPEPHEIDETNPIPEPLANPIPSQNNETNPIPEPVAPAVSAAGDETNPIPAAEGPTTDSNCLESAIPNPQPPVPNPHSAPVPRRGFRYYNGKRLPLAAPDPHRPR